MKCVEKSASTKESQRKKRVRDLARHMDAGGTILHKETREQYGFHSVPNRFFDHPKEFEKVEIEDDAC